MLADDEGVELGEVGIGLDGLVFDPHARQESSGLALRIKEGDSDIHFGFGGRREDVDDEGFLLDQACAEACRQTGLVSSGLGVPGQCVANRYAFLLAGFDGHLPIDLNEFFDPERQGEVTGDGLT